MSAPFQCLLASPLTPGAPQKHLLLGAAGSKIYSFSADTGVLLSSWSHKTGSNTEKEKPASKPSPSKSDTKPTDTVEPPAKRRKHAPSGHASDSSSAEIVVENGSKKRRRPKQPIIFGHNVTKLIHTSSGGHVVAVTGEDKCIRVFELHKTGVLKQLSERHMPKRPSTIALTSDEATILCADKFGDVYALPLFESSPKLSAAAGDSSDAVTDPTVVKKQNQAPASASALTVHTKQNLRALNNQIRFPKKAEKKMLDFDHQLLLGHVSLLTDLVHVSIKPGEGIQDSDAYRIAHYEESYIITADRDEHIRVSRGLPQSHIIQTYCLGHTEFVNKLCVPHWLPDTLISGGGDDFILAWDWRSGRLRHKADLLTHVRDFARRYHRDKHSVEICNKETTVATVNLLGSLNKVAVSGIWAVQGSESEEPGSRSNLDGQVIVTCEGIPALFIFDFSSDKLTFRECLIAEGNVLDLAVLKEQKSILYSMDNIHEPFSTNTFQQSYGKPVLGTYSYVQTEKRWVSRVDALQDLNRAVDAINTWATTEYASQDEQNTLSERLYGIEHFRKRGLEEDNQADQVEDDINVE